MSEVRREQADSIHKRAERAEGDLVLVLEVWKLIEDRWVKVRYARGCRRRAGGASL